MTRILRRDIGYIYILSTLMFVSCVPFLHKTSKLKFNKSLANIYIINPLDGTFYPRDIYAPTITWNNTAPKAQKYIVQVQCAKHVWQFSTNTEQFRLGDKAWGDIKQQCREMVELYIFGLSKDRKVVANGKLSFFISTDEIGDVSLFFRSVPLPAPSEDNLDRVSWILANPRSGKMKIIMSGQNRCFNCHIASQDGKLLGFELNGKAGNRAGYFTTKLQDKMVVDKQRIFDWNSNVDTKYKFEGKFGATFSSISPDNRYVISSIYTRFLFVDYPGAYEFGSYFWTVSGLLGYKDLHYPTKKIKLLSGADDKSYIHAWPDWAPKSDWIVFARARARKIKLLNEEMQRKELVNTYKGLDKKYGVQFSLYRIRFNQGKGGVAEPIKGADSKEFSAYNPRVSPDQKWIVFTRSKYGFALRPDSDLYIIPFNGGKARRLVSNGDRMDSWHSWSPNGKWLIFSTKSYGPYTIMALTNIDSMGNASVPVLLRRFRERGKVVNLPIFINRPFDQINSLKVPEWNP